MLRYYLYFCSVLSVCCSLLYLPNDWLYKLPWINFYRVKQIVCTKSILKIVYCLQYNFCLLCPETIYTYNLTIIRWYNLLSWKVSLRSCSQPFILDHHRWADVMEYLHQSLSFQLFKLYQVLQIVSVFKYYLNTQIVTHGIQEYFNTCPIEHAIQPKIAWFGCLPIKDWGLLDLSAAHTVKTKQNIS